MITSETRGASTPARSSAALIAVLPSSWAGNDANALLNAPTGVRVALTITTSSFMTGSFRAVWGYYDAGWPQVLDICHREAAGPRQGAKARKAAQSRPMPRMPRPRRARMACNHKRVAASDETAYFGGKVTSRRRQGFFAKPEIHVRNSDQECRAGHDQEIRQPAAL